MNLIALGFALTDALHNPWLHGAALVVLLLCLPRLLGIVYIPHTQVGIIEKIWSSKGSLRAGYSSATPMAHRAKVRAGKRKAGINLQENAGTSKPMEDFIRQFTGGRLTGNGDPLKRETNTAEKTASR